MSITSLQEKSMTDKPLARKVVVCATWKTPRAELLAACAAMIHDVSVPRENWDEECEALADLALERVTFSYHGVPNQEEARKAVARLKAHFIRDLRSLLVCPHCGGEGVVPHSYSNEAGHRVDDALPCPQCTRPVRDELPY